MNGVSRECRICRTTVIASKEEDLSTLMDIHKDGAYHQAAVEARAQEPIDIPRYLQEYSDWREKMLKKLGLHPPKLRDRVRWL